MAPPLVRGRALARQRVAGIVFLVVIGLLVQTSIWLYQKKFVDVMHVTLKTDRVGNQLSVHADVKVRGLVIGEVRSVHSDGQVATLDLALDPKKAALLPQDVTAQLLPKTLFGEKEVVLVTPDISAGGYLENGSVITQDHSTTAMETATALNDLLPLLKALHPDALSLALTNFSSALRGKGDALGRNLTLAGAYFQKINPQLPQMGHDLQGLADLADTLQQTSPDLLKSLDNFAYSSRSLVQERASLDAFLRSTDEFAGTTRDIVAQNEGRFDALAHDSKAPLQLYAHYSNNFACMLNRIAFSEIEGERVFGGAQPGLHITVEATRDHGGYAPGDEPKWNESRNFACFGLGPKPIIPFPSYANAQDGYRDSAPAEDPHQGPGGCCDRASSGGSRSWEPTVTESPRAAVVRSTPMPPGTTTLDALLVAPVMGNG